MSNERTELRNMLDKQTGIFPEVRAQVIEASRYPRETLTTLEQQSRYIITVHLQQKECPWCDSAVSYFEAITEEASHTYKLGFSAQETRCPHCKKRLVETVPFMGTWFWSKDPGDKNPDRKLPV